MTMPEAAWHATLRACALALKWTLGFGRTSAGRSSPAELHSGRKDKTWKDMDGFRMRGIGGTPAYGWILFVLVIVISYSIPCAIRGWEFGGPETGRHSCHAPTHAKVFERRRALYN